MPGRWLVLSVGCSRAEDASLLADALVRLGGRAVWEDGDRLVTHLPESVDPARLAKEAEALLGPLAGQAGVDVRLAWQPHEAWEELWKRDLAPRRVTPRMVVTPSWCEARVGPHDLVIVVDPGMAFGTAEHGTTRGCLRLLDPLVRRGDRVLDVGTGSGILAIAAAKLGAVRILGLEGDPYAVEAAVDNARRNGVADRVEVREVWADDGVLRGLGGQGGWTGVTANLERGLIDPLLPGLHDLLGSGGWLVASGILARDWDEWVPEVESLGLRLDGRDVEGDWCSGLFVRRDSNGAGSPPESS